jgi:hypothetical protein
MLVAGEARAPGIEHLATLGTRLDLKKASKIIDEVRAAITRFPRFADKAGVPARLRNQTAKALALSSPRKRFSSL